MNQGGEQGHDDYGLPPVDVEIPDDARELFRDVQAYHRELRALRRHERSMRWRAPFRRSGIAIPLLAGCLIAALVAVMISAMFTQNPYYTGPNPGQPSNASSASGGVGKSPASGRTGQSPASGRTGQSPASGRTGQSPASGKTGQSPASGKTGQSPASGKSGQSPASGRTDQSPAPGRTGQSSRSSTSSGNPSTSLGSGGQAGAGPTAAARLPGKTIRVEGKPVPLRTLISAALAIVPANCRCSVAVRQLLEQAESAGVIVYLVGPRGSNVATLDRLATQSARKPKSTRVATDDDNALTSAYPAIGLTILLVDSHGLVTVDSGLGPNLMLKNQLQLLRPAGHG